MILPWLPINNPDTWALIYDVQTTRLRECDSPSCDMETGTGIVTMWPWHSGLELGSQSRTSESLSGWLCVRCPMSQVNITPGSHMVTLGIGLCNSHLWFSLNWTSSLFRSSKAICLLRRNATAWWLMVSGRDLIWQGLSTCVNPTCVTCLGSVSGITSTPTSHWLYYPSHQGGKRGHNFT